MDKKYISIKKYGTDPPFQHMIYIERAERRKRNGYA